jgi:hypothetical protein
MKRKVTIGIGLVITVMLFFSCRTAIGPRTIVRDRIDYISVLSDSWKEQMLLNIVKLRYGDAPVFLDVASVINSYELSGSANLNGSWKFLPDNGFGGDAGIEGFYANRPTITYSPLTGEKFAKSLISPLPFSSILSLIQAGFRADVIFRVFIQSVNGLENHWPGRRSVNAGFSQFNERMKRIQEAGAFGLRFGSENEEEILMIVFREKNDKEIEDDITEVKKILGLDLQTREFKVSYGAFQTDKKEIAILSRSMLQVLFDLAYYVDVPEMDVKEKRVQPGFNNEVVDGVPIPPLIKISSSSQKPDDTFVAVPYQKNWFWIDNKDLFSKQILSFLMFSFALVETGGTEGTPIVTVPVR